MGIQRWGALGGFQKKSGPAIGRWQKGQNLIGPLPHPSQKPPTDGHLLARKKFATVVGWQKWISPIIRVGFQNAHTEKETAFNAAFVKNYRNAVVVTGNVITLDYVQLQIASGMLSRGFMTVVATTVDAQLDYSWGAGIANGVGSPTDKVTIVVYNTAKDEFCSMVAAAQRSALGYDMPVPVNWSGDQVYTWLFFVSENGKVSKLPSGAQLASRMKMALMVDFLRPLLSVINLGFALKAAGTGRTSYNLALGYHLRHAIVGAYPDFALNYEMVKLSLAAGEVAGPYMPAATLQEDGLLFSWQMEAGGSWNYEGDRAIMVAYFPDRAAAVFNLDGPERSQETGLLKLGPGYRTLRMEVYLAFVAADRSGISDSIYLGNING